MRCNEARELIQLYMDNELESRSTLAVRQHLDECTPCSRLLENLTNQDRLLREYARSMTLSSESLRERVREAIRPRPAFSLRALFLPAWMRFAAAVAVLGILAAFVSLREGWIPGLQSKVYAAAALDHDAHCGLDKASDGISDMAVLSRLAGEHVSVQRIPDLSLFGYRSSHGTICKINDLEFLHLIFYDSSGQALSLFLRRHSPGLLATGLTHRSSEGYNISSVAGSGVDILLVTAAAEARAPNMIRSVASQI